MRTRENTNSIALAAGQGLLEKGVPSSNPSQAAKEAMPANSEPRSTVPGFASQLRPVRPQLKPLKKNAFKKDMPANVALCHDVLVKILSNFKEGIKADASQRKKHSNFLAAIALSGAPMLVSRSFNAAAKAVVKADPDIMCIVDMHPVLREFSMLAMETNKATFKTRVTNNFFCATDIDVPFAKLNKWQIAMTLDVLKSLAEKEKIEYLRNVQFDFSSSHMPLELTGKTLDALRRSGQLATLKLNLSNMQVDSGREVYLLQALKHIKAPRELTLTNREFSFAHGNPLGCHLLNIVGWNAVCLDGHRYTTKNEIQALANEYNNRLIQRDIRAASMGPLHSSLVYRRLPSAAFRIPR
ncbi:MAG: hypothetical protein V4695_03045 [Pseudomonadota bacterium]